MVDKYRECRRNHAASIGRYAIDGCGEFLKHGEDGTPEALLCGACGCHRSFHRREIPNCRHATGFLLLHHPAAPPPLPPPPPPPMILYNVEAAPLINQQQNDVKSETLGTGEIEVEMTKSKKSRTRLKMEQKNKMMSFAERLGWRIQRHDGEEICQFCSEIGITSHAFKVWVNNNRCRRELKQERF